MKGLEIRRKAVFGKLVTGYNFLHSNFKSQNVRQVKFGALLILANRFDFVAQPSRPFRALKFQ